MHIRDSDEFECCQLLTRKVNVTECYDIQLVRGHLIKECVLSDHGLELDRARADMVCPRCPYNQLQG